MGRKRRKSTNPAGTEQPQRETVAYFGPPDASRRYTKWKESNRDLLRAVPDDSVEVRIYRLVGGGDGIDVRVDQTWAGLFEKVIDGPGNPTSS